MKKIITKTSIWDFDENNKPYSKAYIGEKDIIDERTCSEEYFDKNISKYSGTWRSRGTDHIKISANRIQRKMGTKKAWFVDIKSIEDLDAIIKECGQIVYDGVKVEIYDDYRE